MIRLARVCRWCRAAPPVARDGLIALALTALALSQAAPGADPRLVLAVCVMTLSLVGRRRWPFGTFALAGAGLACALWVGARWPSGLAAAAIAALILATYSMSTHTGAWPLSLGLTIAAVALSGPWQGPVPVSGRLLPVLVLGSAWLVGFVLRRRQRHVVVWQGRVARLEREHEDARAAALAAERARIARELHDVVSHSVSVMVIQAGAARQVLARDPARAASVLGTVEAAGREALGELRRLLGVLGDQPEAPRAPQPGIAQLGCLIERVRAAGLPVTLRVEGVARALPAGVDLAAYRVCQEALTNALKHADRAPTEVVVRYAERELTLRVRDQGRLAPASADIAPGYGLVGMRERVALYGGTLHAGATAERGYEVRALLPLELPPG